MAANQPTQALIISKASQEAVIAFHNQCFNMLNMQYNLREQFRQIDLAYNRENDLTDAQVRAKQANKYGDSSRIQNVTVPIVLPIIESAVTYQSSVFLSGTPIFGISSDAQNEDAALQMESIVSENSTRGGWVRHLQMTMRDGFKYNLGIAEVTWSKQTTAALETDLQFSTKQAKPVETTWEGNVIEHWDVYNSFWDTRCLPTEVPSKGEFAGHTKLMSRIELKEFINKLDDKLIENVIAAFESGLGTATTGSGATESYYIPMINPEATLSRNPRASTDWAAWAGLTNAGKGIQYRNVYEVTTLYAKILPSDFALKVPSPNTPQVWKFHIVNHSVVIYAERQTNAHGLLPVLFMQPLEDGLAYQTKSLATNATPFQYISSAMVNSGLNARRRAISDRGIYDPSRISESHINSPNPSAKIPVKPAAYGKPLAEAYYPIPFRDDQSGIILQLVPTMLNMANSVSGQNPAKQGQFVKGNKTQHEYQDVMNNANGRDQNVAILLEAQFFTPLKEILKINMLQYQGAATIYNPSVKQAVTIDPVALRKSVMAFNVSDGLTPTDKLIGADALQSSLQVIGQSAQIAGAYNIGPMFSYLMKTQGAHLTEFEKSPQQQAYEQALDAWKEASAGTAEQIKILVGAALPEQLSQLIKDFMSKMPPQPKPQDYGYTPQGNGVAPQPQQSQPQATPQPGV
jgi:hypothetical protein